MTPQEQASLDRAFGRIYVKQPNGHLRPLASPTPISSPTPNAQKSTPTSLRTEVPIVAPRQETSAILEKLMGGLPPPPEIKTATKAAE